MVMVMVMMMVMMAMMMMMMVMMVIMVMMIVMMMNNDDYHEFQGLLKDAQICHLEKENELLRQQKESLMAALRGVLTHSSRSTLRNIILALCHHLTNSGTSNL